MSYYFYFYVLINDYLRQIMTGNFFLHQSDLHNLLKVGKIMFFLIKLILDPPT